MVQKQGKKSYTTHSRAKEEVIEKKDATLQVYVSKKTVQNTTTDSVEETRIRNIYWAHKISVLSESGLTCFNEICERERSGSTYKNANR